MSERFGALPLGELHAEGVCAYCGLNGRDGPLCPECGFQHSDPTLKRTVHPMTLAVAHVCVDTVACERRRYNSRRRI